MAAISVPSRGERPGPFQSVGQMAALCFDLKVVESICLCNDRRGRLEEVFYRLGTTTAYID